MHNPGRAAVPPEGPLRELVHDCLDHLDELVAVFVAELRTLEAYASGLVSWSEVRADAEASFELLLRLTAGLPVPERLGDVSERVGRRRAALGVPLETLLQAVRLDFRVLWDALLHRVRPEDLPALVHSAVRVWEAVEQHTMRVHLAYVDEAALLAREREHERSQLVGRLLATDARDAAVVAQVATALEVDPNGRFAVAAATGVAQRPLREAAARLAATGIGAHVQEVDRRSVLIAPLPRASGAVPSRWLRGVPCGVAPVAGSLTAVPRAVRIAAELADVTAGTVDGPRRLADAWPAVVAARLGEPGEALAAEILSAVDSVGPHERDRLLETVSAYLGSGSVGPVAAELFCHRNTVLNRLRRFAELTGCDVTRPEAAALAIVALSCRAARDATAGQRSRGARENSPRDS
jgi:hypothetical protein